MSITPTPGSCSVVRHKALILRRREDYQAQLRTTLGSDFEAFLTAQAYGRLRLDRAHDTRYTMVMHDGQVKFLRRVVGVEPVQEWDNKGLYFATMSPETALRAIEGRPYTRNLRATHYVDLCHDTATGDVWLEDDAGRIC